MEEHTNTDNTGTSNTPKPEKKKLGYFQKLFIILLAVSITSGVLLQKLSAPVLIPWYMEKTYHEKFIYHGLNAGNGGKDSIISAAETPKVKFLAKSVGIFPFNYRVENDYYASIVGALVQAELDEAATKCTAADKVYLIVEPPRGEEWRQYAESHYSVDELNAAFKSDSELMRFTTITALFFGKPEVKEAMTTDAYAVYKEFINTSRYTVLVIDISQYDLLKPIQEKAGNDVLSILKIARENIDNYPWPVMFSTDTLADFERKRASHYFEYFKTQYEVNKKKNYELTHEMEESQ